MAKLDTATPRAAYYQLLQERCLDLINRINGVVGLSFRDLTSGVEFFRLPDASFTTASSIKIPILMALFNAEQEGQFSLTDRVTYDQTKHVAGSGVLQCLTDTVEMSIRDLARLMIHLSDNAATNMCIDLVGFEYVNAMLAGLGMHGTILQRKMIDSEAALNGRENVSTPRDFLEIMTLLYRGAFISETVCEHILAIMAEHPKGLFGECSGVLPSGSKVANKPGGLDGVATDVGLIQIPNRPFVFVVMGNYLHDTNDPALTELVKTVYRFQAQLANSTEFGRQLPLEMFTR
ncbi:MAG: serine hydrolase [Bacillota bacterium]